MSIRKKVSRKENLDPRRAGKHSRRRRAGKVREDQSLGSPGTFGARLVFLISIIYFKGPRAVRLPLAIFSARLRRAQSMNFLVHSRPA